MEVCTSLVSDVLWVSTICLPSTRLFGTGSRASLCIAFCLPLPILSKFGICMAGAWLRGVLGVALRNGTSAATLRVLAKRREDQTYFGLEFDPKSSMSQYTRTMPLKKSRYHACSCVHACSCLAAKCTVENLSAQATRSSELKTPPPLGDGLAGVQGRPGAAGQPGLAHGLCIEEEAEEQVRSPSWPFPRTRRVVFGPPTRAARRERDADAVARPFIPREQRRATSLLPPSHSCVF